MKIDERSLYSLHPYKYVYGDFIGRILAKALGDGLLHKTVFNLRMMLMVWGSVTRECLVNHRGDLCPSSSETRPHDSDLPITNNHLTLNPILTLHY